MTYTKAGSFGWAGGGKSGAIVDLWAESRFSEFPAQGSGPPDDNPPDAGPVTTGSDDGNPGGFLITGITVLQDYYVRIQYGGVVYWGGCPAGSLMGVSGGGDYAVLSDTNLQTFLGPITSNGIITGLAVIGTDEMGSPGFIAEGAVGTSGYSAFVGGNASGAPTSGTWALRSFVVNADGTIWICTVAGTPGTWVEVSGSSGDFANLSDASLQTFVGPIASDGEITASSMAATEMQAEGFVATGATGTSFAAVLAGGNASGAPASGTWSKGTFVVNQDGSVWVCTTAGSPGTWTEVTGGGGGAVSSFNTRTGAVTLAAADIEALFTAAGGVFVGTGSATGEILAKGTTGQVLTVGGSDPSGLEWTTAGTSGVSSFNTRTGAVTPTSGDYTASEVTNAADKSGGTQTFAGDLAAPAVTATEMQAEGFIATGATGTSSAAVLAGGNASGAPTSGTWSKGSFVVNGDGSIWVCTTAGSPGTWTEVTGGGGGGGLGSVLAQVQYAPSSFAFYTLTGTRTALDTTNLTIGPVTFPASGKLRITACIPMTAEINAAADNVAVIMSFLNHSGGARVGPDATLLFIDNSANPATEEIVICATYDAIITGTPSASIQLDLAGRTAGSGTGIVNADDGLTGGNESGPIVMTIYQA